MIEDLHHVIQSKTFDKHNLDITRLVYMLYQDIEVQINRADLKAQLVLSTNAILAVAVASLDIQERLSGEIALENTLLWLAYMGFFLCVVVSVIFALLASFPQRERSVQTVNFYNPVQIAEFGMDAYRDGFLKLSTHDIKAAVLEQIHAKAVITKIKFFRLQRSLSFLIGGIILLGLSQLIALTI